MNDRDSAERPRATEGRDPASADADAASGRGSIIDSILRRAGRMAGGTLDLAIDVATASAMFGDYRLRDLLANTASPERLEAMAEAGHFLRDARETAGLSLAELSERLELRPSWDHRQEPSNTGRKDVGGKVVSHGRGKK